MAHAVVLGWTAVLATTPAASAAVAMAPTVPSAGAAAANLAHAAVQPARFHPVFVATFADVAIAAAWNGHAVQALLQATVRDALRQQTLPFLASLVAHVDGTACFDVGRRLLTVLTGWRMCA